MESFIFIHKDLRKFSLIALVGVILFLIIMLISKTDSLEKKDWVWLAFLGILIVSNIMDPYKTQIDLDKGSLEIKWLYRNKIKILDSEIERITLSTNYIFIFRKSKKALKLPLYGKKQKTQVFNFFNEYSRERKITLINQDEFKS